MTIAECIQTARKARGMTQADLAVAAELPQPQISKIEKGHIGDPGLSTMNALAQALQLPLDVLAQCDIEQLLQALQDSPLETAAAAEEELAADLIALADETIINDLRQWIGSGTSILWTGPSNKKVSSILQQLLDTVAQPTQADPKLYPDSDKIEQQPIKHGLLVPVSGDKLLQQAAWSVCGATLQTRMVGEWLECQQQLYTQLLVASGGNHQQAVRLLVDAWPVTVACDEQGLIQQVHANLVDVAGEITQQLLWRRTDQEPEYFARSLPRQ